MASKYVYKEIKGVRYKLCAGCGEYKPANIDYFHKAVSHGKRSLKSKCKLCRSRESRVKDWVHYNEKGELLCTKCMKYKNPFEFSNSSYEPNIKFRGGKVYVCKECTNKMSHKVKSEVEDFELHIKYLLKHASKRGKESGKGFYIEKTDLYNLYEKQNGLCALSGIKMTSKLFGNKKHLHNVSIDRKDSNLGYTKDNIQLVCSIVNIMKFAQPDNEFIEYCSKIVNYAKRA